MKVIERLFLAIYIPLGIWACLHAGVSWDELIEYETLNANLNAIQGIFNGNYSDYSALLQYRDRYYGIGFHLVSRLFSELALWLNSQIFAFSDNPSPLLFTHFSVFAVFVLSGLLLKSILKKLVSDDAIPTLGMVTYLLWPYLLGHAFVNVKDIPFLFVWLLCTNLVLGLMQLWQRQFLISRKKAALHFFLLGTATAWLLSIRISGLLILIEYATCFLVYLTIGRCNLGKFIKIPHLVAFVLPLLFGVYLLYPVFWFSPAEIFNAVKYMSQHPWDGDTLTAGRFLHPKQSISFYIFAWLALKLPIVIILGWLAIPVALTYRFGRSKDTDLGAEQLNFYALFFTVALILFTLIFIKAGLYNELRQVLFIFPLIFVVGIASLYYVSIKFLKISLVLTSLLFAFDNVALYPYSYTYMNEVVRQLPIGSQFEKDYLGLSIDRSTLWLNQQNHIKSEAVCAVVTPAHLWRSLDRTKYPCVYGYEKLSSLDKPFVFSWLVRDRTDLLPLPTCKLIHEEKIRFPVSSTALVMNQLFFCEPVPNKK